MFQISLVCFTSSNIKTVLHIY